MSEQVTVQGILMNKDSTNGDLVYDAGSFETLAKPPDRKAQNLLMGEQSELEINKNNSMATVDFAGDKSPKIAKDVNEYARVESPSLTDKHHSRPADPTTDELPRQVSQGQDSPTREEEPSTLN